MLALKLISVGKDLGTGYLECLAFQKDGKISTLRIDSKLFENLAQFGHNNPMRTKHDSWQSNHAVE